MILYRLGRRKHARKLDGVGAKMYPGRWNTLDTPMIYCGNNRSLCAMEVLVHINEPPDDYAMTTLFVPDDVSVRTPGLRHLPQAWNSDDYNAPTRALGDAFISSGQHLMLCVPSAVVKDDLNYLLNPLHPDIRRVKVLAVVSFRFDPRLFKKG